jgi:mannitol/fructose-specific phosphotransferase system IIA component (Ntr-type)
MLSPDTVLVKLASGEKERLIRVLIETLAGAGCITNSDAVFTEVMKREKMMSTGVGEGIALPHARTPDASSPVAAFAVTEGPVEFESFDKRPVRIVFLLVGPPHATAQHLRILGRVSRLLHQEKVRLSLLEATRPEQVIEILRGAEARLLAA